MALPDLYLGRFNPAARCLRKAAMHNNNNRRQNRSYNVAIMVSWNTPKTDAHLHGRAANERRVRRIRRPGEAQRHAVGQKHLHHLPMGAVKNVALGSVSRLPAKKGTGRQIRGQAHPRHCQHLPAQPPTQRLQVRVVARGQVRARPLERQPVLHGNFKHNFVVLVVSKVNQVAACWAGPGARRREGR